MRRLIMALLAIVLLGGLLAACGDDDDTVVGESTTAADDTVATESTDTAPADQTVGAAESDAAADESAISDDGAADDSASDDSAAEISDDGAATGDEPSTASGDAAAGDRGGEFCTAFADDAIGGADDQLDEAEIAEVQGAIDRLIAATPPELEEAMAVFGQGTQLLLDETVAADGDIAAAFEVIATEEPDLFQGVLDAQVEIETYCGS